MDNESQNVNIPLQSTQPSERMMQFFECANMPLDEQVIAAPIMVVAEVVVISINAGPERTVALRKLLEARDAAIRALRAR